MRKWVLIFLLLINVIVFFGFAMRGSAPRDSDVEVEQAFELRLVSEVAQESLIKIADQRPQGDIKPWFVEGACILYGGVEKQKTADDIAGFMTEQGLSPLILVKQQATTVKKYHLVVGVPTQLKEKLALETQFKVENISYSVVNINEKSLYQLGVYANAGEAGKGRRELVAVFADAIAPQVLEVLGSRNDYFVQLQDDIDRNLINKINDVLKLTYETLKIEKKVCKGVASTKLHQ